MNDNEDFIGLIDNDNDVSLNGNSDVDMENDSSSDTQEGSEEISTQTIEGNEESSGDLDLTEIYTRLDELEVQNENIIASLSVIEDNSQYFATIKDATGILTSSFVFALIIALIILTYNVLNNFFK